MLNHQRKKELVIALWIISIPTVLWVISLLNSVEPKLSLYTIGFNHSTFSQIIRNIIYVYLAGFSYHVLIEFTKTQINIVTEKNWDYILNRLIIVLFLGFLLAFSVVVNFHYNNNDLLISMIIFIIFVWNISKFYMQLIPAINEIQNKALYT